MSAWFGDTNRATAFNSFSRPSNAFSEVTGQTGGALVAVLVIVLSVTIALGYLVYRFLVSSLKATVLSNGIVHCRSGATTVAASKLPALTNGREWSVSFWVYVENAAHTTSDKNILTFGKDQDSAAMMVLMDRNVNRMYLVFRTTMAGTASAVSALNQFKQGTTNPTSHIVVPVEYVPLSRWVMVTAVCDQDTVTLYIDNNIYSVVSGARFRQGAIIADPSDDVMIGSASNGADAYIAKIRFFNYGISVFQNRSYYQSGPGSGGILGWLGINKYKLQWPVISATS